MKLNVYAVLDAKVGVFGGLNLDITDDAAIRNFSDGVNDPNPKNAWYRHPEDYALYKIGTYQQDTGNLKGVESLQCLVTASACKSMNGVDPLTVS